MMDRFDGRESWAGSLKELRPRLDRQAAEDRLDRGEQFEGISVADQDLAGLPLEGKSFRMADARGLILFNEERGESTDIKHTDWTDADIADLGNFANFTAVDAEGAKFGFSEPLKDRRARALREGKKLEWYDCGGYHNFVANNGNFPKTTWDNIDFGGQSDYEAVFFDADLMDAVFRGCNLAGLDWSRARLTNIRIIDPESMNGLQIYEKYVADIVAGVEYTDPAVQAKWEASLKKNGEQGAVEQYLGIYIVKMEN